MTSPLWFQQQWAHCCTADLPPKVMRGRGLPNDNCRCRVLGVRSYGHAEKPYKIKAGLCQDSAADLLWQSQAWPSSHCWAACIQGQCNIAFSDALQFYTYRRGACHD